MWAFFVFQGTLAEPEQLSEIGGYGGYDPPLYFVGVGTTLTLCFPPTFSTKNVLYLWDSYGCRKNFSQKFR